MKDPFIVYAVPDGKIKKDFTRKKRSSRACNHCRKSKIRCDLEKPCDMCKRRKLTESCEYETEFGVEERMDGNNWSNERSIGAENQHDSEKIPKEDDSGDLNSSPDKSRKLQFSSPTNKQTPTNLRSPVNMRSPNSVRSPADDTKACIMSSVIGTSTGVARNYVGSWHEDVTIHREPGVRSLLNQFETMKSQRKLACMRPWQRQQLDTVPEYVDPFLCGIDPDIVQNLINVYWQSINPIESVIEPGRFWEEFDLFGKLQSVQSSSSDWNRRVLFSARVWLVLAYSSRALGTSDEIVKKIQTDLNDEMLVFSVSKDCQNRRQFVEDPWEFFLYCAETCISSGRLLSMFADLYSLETLVLYVQYLHDGSDRNWLSWTYLGMANHSAQRLGLHREPRDMEDSESSKNHSDEAGRRRKLFFTLFTMNMVYAVDLGQICTAFPESMVDIEDDELEFIKQPDGAFILSKYHLSCLLRRAITLVGPLYNRDGQVMILSQLKPILELETSTNNQWDLIPDFLKLREGSPSGRIRMDISLGLEDPPVPPKIVFQRYVLDSLIQKIRHLFYRPFLHVQCDPEDLAFSVISNFHKNFRSAARALLENQFEVANRSSKELKQFSKFRWNYIFLPAFHASVLVCLQRPVYERDEWENKLVKSSVGLYKGISSYVGCSAAKAHLVLGALLQEEEEERSVKEKGSANEKVRKALPPIPSSLDNMSDEFFTGLLGDVKGA